MPSPACDRAVSDALQYGRALLKFISPNDVGSTGSHQSGYYIPIAVWNHFTPQAPEKERNHDHLVDVLWPDGRTTHSCVKWYGVRTRREYRITRFGRDFPWLTDDCIGDLLILIPVTLTSFIAHVLDLEEDIQDIQAALGLEITGSWAMYEAGKEEAPETEDECVDRRFRSFAKALADFPTTTEFSHQSLAAMQECIESFKTKSPDERILKLMEAEYRLFRLVERKLCEERISRLFKSVDDFLSTAASIMNRRKSRAGRSLENHVQYVLQDAGIPHDIRPRVDGKPDILIPGRDAYLDRKYPVSKLFMVGVKTTCKDRWRQVLNEAERIPGKHILTVQQGISRNQLDEMNRAQVTLIVPKPLHKQYPRDTAITILTVDQFVDRVKKVVL